MRASHCSRRGRPLNGRLEAVPGGSGAGGGGRSRGWGAPRETTIARPGVTAEPGQRAAALIRNSSTDSIVVLPAFQRLVISVTIPDARISSHSQETSATGSASKVSDASSEIGMVQPPKSVEIKRV